MCARERQHTFTITLGLELSNVTLCIVRELFLSRSKIKTFLKCLRSQKEETEAQLLWDPRDKTGPNCLSTCHPINPSDLKHPPENVTEGLPWVLKKGQNTICCSCAGGLGQCADAGSPAAFQLTAVGPEGPLHCACALRRGCIWACDHSTPTQARTLGFSCLHQRGGVCGVEAMGPSTSWAAADENRGQKGATSREEEKQEL